VRQAGLSVKTEGGLVRGQAPDLALG